MGIFSFFKKVIFGSENSKKDKFEIKTSFISDSTDANNYESPRIDSASMQIDSNQSINQSLNQSISKSDISDTRSNVFISNKEPSIETEPEKEKKSLILQEDSLKLGVAAGFVGRSLMNIEEEIENLSKNSITKNWIEINLLPQIKHIIDELYSLKQLFNSHEENEEKRFEALMDVIKRIYSIAQELPHPYGTQIINELEYLKRSQLTPKMKNLIEIVKSHGEISYHELSQKLHISQDALRGLLSRTIKLTDEIERFQKDGKGWVRYKNSQEKQEELEDKSDLHRFKSIESNESLLDKTTSEERTYDLSDLP